MKARGVRRDRRVYRWGGRYPVASHRSFGGVGLCDGPVGHVTAVAEAANAQARSINRLGGNNMVYTSHQVAEIVAAPIMQALLAECLAIACTSAWIGRKYRVALALKNLELVDIAVAPCQ